ncbi:cell wall-active antibiotics response protein LiaF [Paenibacillus sp. N1-5-1-14]|uniref:cell wall-active antibiotics response protein LiaF n=1 Tax=Paenibacillus radicibacter TaxID=2972488 RepID=UPI002158A371|nr:cell wall-active antibiotics response protein LiaF [Paenibacillus radicibacter]MCR8643150.1 cell wall-active antibiotics response protein LiaF [Paenibacillus radicibacter]
MNLRFLERGLTGLVLIGIGVLFLLHFTGVIHINLSIREIISTFWPVILIYFGLRGLIAQRNYGFGASIGSIVMIVIGSIFLSRHLGWSEFSFSDIFRYMLPVILIVVGLRVIFGRGKKKSKYDYDESRYDYKEDHSYKGYKEYKEEDYDIGATGAPHSKKYDTKPNYHYVNTYSTGKTENRSTFIGDVHMGRGGEYWELHPMNISSFIGDTTIDLTTASIPYGETKLNISAFIGDVKILVPNDMDIEVKVAVNSFIGDMRVFERHEDGFMRSMNMQTPFYEDAPRKLRVNVSMFIGDVRVKKIG